MFDLMGWDHMSTAPAELIAMFQGWGGMSEADLIDHIAGVRRSENTYQELQPDGSTVTLSTKIMSREQREKFGERFLSRLFTKV